MRANEADELKTHLAQLRHAVWDLECACPGRPEMNALVERLDDLERWLEDCHDPAIHEHDL